MDRKIEKRRWTWKRLILIGASISFTAWILHGLFYGDRSRRLTVAQDRLVVSIVTQDAFQEWIPTNGTLVPIKTVFIDAIEGGRVEERFVEEGNLVEKWQPLLKLSNTNLLLDIMNREAEVFQQINELRNTRILMEQRRLELQSNLLDLDHQILKQKRLFERVTELAQNQLISGEEQVQAQNDFEYLQARRELTLNTYQQDSLFRCVQTKALEASVQQMQANLEIVKQKLESLTLKAPICGQLTSLDAETGQSKQRGDRIGQIDVLDGFKVRCAIDEHYITRVSVGQIARMKYAGADFTLTISKIYPEVREGRFEVDMEFDANEPEGIRRGQTLRINLELGSPSEALLLKRGGFYQSTGGRWAFVLNASGCCATKQDIKIGRQNNEVFEILDGLKIGDQVIISSYETFGNAEKLMMSNN